MPKPTKPRKYSEATWFTEHQMGGGTGLARPEAVMEDLDLVLNALDMFTASGKNPPHPVRSVAKTPGLTTVQLPSRGSPLNALQERRYYDESANIVKEMMRDRQAAHLASLLPDLDFPDLPPLPVTEVPAPRGKLPASIAAAPALTALFELLAYSGDTNENNDGELAKKQGPKISNREEYEKELQFMLQRMAR